MEATAVLAKNSSLLEYTGSGRIVNRSLAPVRASRGTVYCRPDCWTIGGVERAPRWGMGRRGIRASSEQCGARAGCALKRYY